MFICKYACAYNLMQKVVTVKPVLRKTKIKPNLNDMKVESAIEHSAILH